MLTSSIDEDAEDNFMAIVFEVSPFSKEILPVTFSEADSLSLFTIKKKEVETVIYQFQPLFC